MLTVQELNKFKQAKTNFKIITLKDVKTALMLKYGNLTKAAQVLNVNYQFLSHVLAGRIYYIYIVQAIQQDLGLTDQQVLEFWPLLKKWPKDTKTA